VLVLGLGFGGAILQVPWRRLRVWEVLNPWSGQGLSRLRGCSVTLVLLGAAMKGLLGLAEVACGKNVRLTLRGRLRAFNCLRVERDRLASGVQVAAGGGSTLLVEEAAGDCGLVARGSKVGLIDDGPGVAAFLHWLLGGDVDERVVNGARAHLVAAVNAAAVLQAHAAELGGAVDVSQAEHLHLVVSIEPQGDVERLEVVVSLGDEEEAGDVAGVDVNVGGAACCRGSSK
jgi:hypothetical protein